MRVYGGYALETYVMTMTAAIWAAMAPAERDKARDTSGLHPALKGLEGRKVTVSARDYGRKTFIVGRTAGWKPAHLAIARRNAMGSSDLICADEQFTVVRVWP